MSALPFLVGDSWVVGSGEPIRSVNPADATLNYEVSTADASQVDAAVRAAVKAQANPCWRRMKPHERARLLYRVAELIAARAEELAGRQMRENGKLRAECRGQAASAAATFRYYAAVCESASSELTAPRGSYYSMTVYEPVGVAAALTPWNSPLTMEAQKVAPALAAGNAVVLKPSEVTPTLGLELGRLCLEAGVPPGIVNVVAGRGQPTGLALLWHPQVRMFAFTGGTATGRVVARVAAERLVPTLLELGGKSPQIVFADADLDKAVAGVIDGIFSSTGQSCVAGSRLFVEASLYDRFLERLVEGTRKLKVGLPDAEGSQVGPLASFAHRDRVESYIEAARKERGEVLVGGRRPDSQELKKGAFYLPTVIVGLSNRARVCQEEIFGPVLCVLPFKDEDELVAQANDTVYGLACGIWTADYRKAWRVARAIEAGTIWINTYKQLSISTPFGGFKESGLGREKGVGGMRAYQLAKSLYWQVDA
jgi:acyl-CoA reductase-like NAD-dependent aldehyde dehydrogenase